MRGRIAVLGLLTMGLSWFLSANQALAFAFIEDADPWNQAATNSALDITSTQPNYAAGPPFQDPPGSSTVLNDPFVIQDFNAAKFSTNTETAVLTEVVVSLKYQFDNGIQMAFISPSVSTVSAQGSMHLDIGNNGAGQPVFNDIVGAPTFSTSKTLTYDPTAAPNTPNTITTPNFTTAVTPLVSSTSATAYFDSSHLGMFSGTGKVLLPVYATAISSYTNSSGNGAGGVITTASAALSVQYYYQLVPVPEPSSMVLVGLGTLGLSAVGVRNRRKVVTSAG